MPLFKLTKKKAKRIRSLGIIKPEDKLHNIVEENLNVFFPNLVLIKHKPVFEGKEFDTLAFDTKSFSPVILEYKVSKNRAVGDQVDSYLVILQRNKELVRFHVRDVLPKAKKVDFRTARTIVIANEFSDVQINALSLRQHYVEMWKYTFYEDFLLLESLKPALVTGIQPPLKGQMGEVRKSITIYEDISHFGSNRHTTKLYNELHEAIMSLDSNMQFKINKHFIGYKAVGFYFATVKPQVESIRVQVKLSKSFRSRIINVKGIPASHQTPMTEQFNINSHEQIPAAIKALKMALEESL